MGAEREFSLTTASDNFLIDYKSRSDNMYNSDNIMDGRIKKYYNFTGKQKNVETHLSFSGGVGSRKIPLAGTAKYRQAVITSNKVYGRAQIEREAIKASMSSRGAFRQATKEVARKTVESFMRYSSMIFFGDGTGIIAKGDGTGANISGNGSEGTPFIVTFPAAQWKEASWEEEDLVQVVTGLDASNQSGTMEGGDTETNLLRVYEVDPDNRQVKLVGTSTALGTTYTGAALPATVGFCMQRSYLGEPQGLKGVLTPYAGTTQLYGIDVQRRWSAYSKDAAGEGLSTDLMNHMMLKIEKRFKTPKMILTSYTQFQNMLALLEDQKTYEMANRNIKKGKEIKGKFSFVGVEFMSTRGAIGVFTDRFCEDDRMYFLNDDYIERHHRPDFGWFKDDGTVFLRISGEDEYEARYGGYFENFITPTAHGVLYGLAS